MTKFFDPFNEKIPFSVHAGAYDRAKSNSDDKYGALWSEGFRTGHCEVNKIAAMVRKYVTVPSTLVNGMRNTERFVASQIGVIDIDATGYTLDEALNEWCDTVCVIGTTRNHRVLKRGMIGDRFRIFFVFDRLIEDVRDYEFNMAPLIQKYGGDACAKSPVQFYYPFSNVVMANDFGYLQPAIEAPEILKKDLRGLRVNARFAAKKRGVGKLVYRFLTEGKPFTPSLSRHWSIWVSHLEMRESGYSYEEAEDRLLQSPFDRSGMTERGIRRCIAHAEKKFRKNIEAGVYEDHFEL